MTSPTQPKPDDVTEFVAALRKAYPMGWARIDDADAEPLIRKFRDTAEQRAQLIDGGDSDLADYDPSNEALSKADDILSVIQWPDKFVSQDTETLVEAVDKATPPEGHDPGSSRISDIAKWRYRLLVSCINAAIAIRGRSEPGKNSEPQPKFCGYTLQEAAEKAVEIGSLGAWEWFQAWHKADLTTNDPSPEQW